MRAFLAVKVPVAVRETLRAAQESLARDLPGVRWVRPGSVHLTLHFLGEMDAQQEIGLREAAADVCAGIPTGTARARGLGAYPARGAPRVLWVGVDQDKARTLSRLQAALRPVLEGQRIEVDGRPFAPHLTLGRARTSLSRRPVERALTAAGPTDLGSIPIRSCILFESILDPGGARYRSRAILDLGG